MQFPASAHVMWPDLLAALSCDFASGMHAEVLNTTLRGFLSAVGSRDTACRIAEGIVTYEAEATLIWQGFGSAASEKLCCLPCTCHKCTRCALIQAFDVSYLPKRQSLVRKFPLAHCGCAWADSAGENLHQTPPMLDILQENIVREAWN